MPNSFGKYTGGIQGVQGILESGANIAKYQYEGLASFGEGLARGIQQYNENTQKREVVDAQSKALGAQLQRYAQMFSQSPEYSGLAEGLQTHIQTLSEVPSMSLGKALGAVNGAQAAFANIDKELAITDTIRKANIERGIIDAESGLPAKEKYDINAVIQSGKWGYNPNESYTSNETKLRSALRKAKELDPSIKFDENEAVAKWRANVQTLAQGIVDEQHKATILDEIEAARRNEQRVKDVQTSFDKEGLFSGIQKLGSLYGEDLTKDMSLTTETTQALIDAKNKPEEQKPLVNQDISSKLAQQKSEETTYEAALIRDRIVRLEQLRKDVFENDRSKVGILADRLKNYAISAGVNIIDSPVSLGPTSAGAMASGAINLSLTSKEKQIARDMIQDEGDVLSSVDLNINGADIVRGARLTSEQRTAGINAVNTKIEELNKKLAETQKTPEQIKKEVQSGLKGDSETKPIAELVGKEDLQFGTKEMTRDIPVEQKKAQVADYFRQRFGYVPSGFNDVYSKLNPSSVLQTTEVDGQKLLWDGQKWTPLKADKALTVDEQMKLRSRQFGAIDKEGRPVKTEVIPNSGIYAYGTFNSASTKRVDDFRQFTSDFSQVQVALDNLERLNKQFGGSLSPSARQEADQWKARIRSLLKMEVANTGSVSDYEQRRIDAVTPAVNELLSLSGANQKAIDVLRQKLTANLVSEGAAFGVDIEVRTGANSREAAVRQAKLDRYRNK